MDGQQEEGRELFPWEQRPTTRHVGDGGEKSLLWPGSQLSTSIVKIIPTTFNFCFLHRY
ncbi:hypothetical protein C0J52_09865 [Blattella germanica]|nr:hypothetical protein C0J52_09865 [Blattella germanica]